MGCSSGKMVAVNERETAVKQSENCILERTKDNNNNDNNKKDITKENRINNTEVIEVSAKRGLSAKSQKSNDSGLGDGDVESLNSLSTTTTTTSRSRSGLTRMLRNLSAKSNSILPRQSESEVLEKLRSEGFLASQTHTAKSGVSFELIEEFTPPKRLLPPRLAKLEKSRKRKKLLTQQDIEEKLMKAEERRKEVEAGRLEKIQLVAKKSDVQHAQDSYMVTKKLVAEHVQEKVDTAAENRAKKFREMRDKLRAKEAHAQQVRLRKKSIVVNDSDEIPDIKQGEE